MQSLEDYRSFLTDMTSCSAPNHGPEASALTRAVRRFLNECRAELALIDSMTPAERQNPRLLFESSRLLRAEQGAGVRPSASVRVLTWIEDSARRSRFPGGCENFHRQGVVAKCPWCGRFVNTLSPSTTGIAD